MIPFLENVVGNASAVTILAISVERYRVACRTMTQSPASSRTMVKTCLLIWLTSVLGAMPFVFITQHKRSILLDGTTVMVCKTPIVLPWHKVYIVITTAVFFILPMLAILVLYANVGFRLISLFKTEQEKLQSYPREIVKMKRQMIQIIVTVVLIFFICHTPYRAVVLWSMFGNRMTVTGLPLELYLSLIYMTRILLYSNHAINPFVYNFVSRKFRRALLWLCCERRQKARRMDDWRDYANQRHSLRHESFRGMHLLGARSEPDGIVREREEVECFNRCNHFHRNDFLVLYENLMLLE
ncbi:hypothetical protein BaRGS_00003404 [Batillaria attramentaria]|uniref:G-protein coupled receptors family 1 profile domain-containing protein n=1 Tax=Batillaria attramentaria TaxID=370345 RepID=A0ABD0M216_9CAEN|nr:hypothetical protein BaRGS_029712 [Batillaria attramentaria]